MNNNTPTDSTDDAEDLPPSKTRLKHEAQQLVKLGEDILKLQKEDIKNLQLPDELDEAIQTALKISSRSGLKRQRLYIGKLLRNLDHEKIAQQIEKIRHRHDTNTARFKRLEAWRDRLIDNDKQVFGDILQHCPHVDRQHIHQLVRQAQKERQQARPPAAARKLFRYLQSLQAENPGQEASTPD